MGVLTVLGLIAFGLIVRADVSEVGEMGPWPSRDVRPEQVAAIDLQHLGLTTVQAKDARTIKKWGSGNYRAGTTVTYSAEQQEIVAITALQYSDTATALSEFGSLTEWAKENCRWSSYATWFDTGVIRCGVRGAHARMLLSGYWILDIVALDGGPLPAQERADKVRDAVAANWKQAQETRR